MKSQRADGSLTRKVIVTAASLTLVIGMMPGAAFAEKGSAATGEAPDANTELAAAETSLDLSGSYGEADLEATSWRDCGTCEWMIDGAGKLTVRPKNGVSGVLRDWRPDSLQYAPWSWNDNVKTAVFEKGVQPATCVGLLCSCPNLTSVDLSGLDTSKVTDMHAMFDHDSALVSVDLSCLDTSNVIAMRYVFNCCSSLESVNLSGISTSQVILMGAMFAECKSLKTIYVDSQWSTAGLQDKAGGMFSGCTSLVGGAGTIYDPNRTSATYARVDGGPNSTTPGYFTLDTSGSPFPDVSKSAWYYDSVTRASGLGLISGYDNGTFGPLNTLTRAQAATILWRYYEPAAAKAYDSAKSTTKNGTGMADVQSYEWYTGAANWAVKNGVVSGFDNPDGTKSFSPDGTITREQLCVIVANASAKYAGSKVTGASRTKLNSMPDAAGVDAWAADSVAWGLNNGVISGKESGGRRLIDPIGQMTRAEMAAVLMNAIDKSLLGN